MDRAIIRPSPYSFGVAMHQGSRPRQEDFACVVGSCFAVFDGLGGHEDGDMASRLSGEGFVLGEAETPLYTRLQQAHMNLLLLRRPFRERKPMSTVVSIDVGSDAFICGWQGDSRCYALQRGVLTQISSDHADPFSHAVLNTLGGVEEAEFRATARSQSDRILLCSDGVHGRLQEDDIALIMATGTPQECASLLVEKAVTPWDSSDTYIDNATAIVIDLRK